MGEQTAVLNQRLWRGGPRLANLVVLALTAIGLLGSLALVWSTISSERAQRAQAMRTNQVMIALRDIGHAALNAETGQRGYFITLDREYLDSYKLGRASYPPALARLKRLLADVDDPRQAELLEGIERHGDAKFRELALTVAEISRGEIRKAQQRILSNRGHREMMRLRKVLSEMEAIEYAVLQKATNEAASAEDRVLPMLSFTLLLIIAALGLGFWQALRAARSEARAAQAAEIARARDRADLLARELNHRVKNLFAVVLAIIRMSARGEPAAAPVVDRIARRIQALLDAHEVTQGSGADTTADLRALIEKTLAPYVSREQPADIEGPSVALSGRQATPIGLVLHELATNAVKYGAWSKPGGSLRVHWRIEAIAADPAECAEDPAGGATDHPARRVAIEWRERCVDGCEATDRAGFGNMLMTSSARQLGGDIQRDFLPDGIKVRIIVPIRD